MGQARLIDGPSKRLPVSKKTTRPLVISEELKGHSYRPSMGVSPGPIRSVVEAESNGGPLRIREGWAAKSTLWGSKISRRLCQEK